MASTASDAAADAAFAPAAHRKYIKRVSEDADSFEYAITEHLRMSGIYWACAALELVDGLDTLDGAAIVKFVLECQHANGGFGRPLQYDRWPGQSPRLRCCRHDPSGWMDGSWRRLEASSVRLIDAILDEILAGLPRVL